KVAEARAAIAGASDEHLMNPWSLEFNGKTVFTMPRVAVLRSMMLNHIIHHRAQLGVYLRLNNVPVPAIYGPPLMRTVCRGCPKATVAAKHGGWHLTPRRDSLTLLLAVG